MIGKLSGRIDYVAEDHALIEAGGVGYLVHCAPQTLARLEPGTAAALYTDLVVREDLMQLFGFASLAEREWHRLLTSVQGVGAKVSLAILGTLGTEGVSRALALEDAAAVRRAPGVGPKLAQRIVNELKGRAPDVLSRTAAMNGRATASEAAQPTPGAAPMAVVAPAPEPAPGRAAAEGEALSALVNLGYDRAEALRAVLEAEGTETAVLIKTALRALDTDRQGRA
ncbi:MAG: Holliday junction branch migration protein RuvA [Pseudomonadota bacterium]